jgi:geranylgeranyl diphosphate synthase, type I
MDRSDTRRGQPAVHRRFAGLHRAAGGRSDGEQFGAGAAILVGDLCLGWSDEMFFGSGLGAERLVRARPIFDEMRTELMGGQYLDLLEARRGTPAEAAVRRVLTYKSGKYTIERPLHLGLALAGGPASLARGYSAYGLPLGEAFQLRDDVLGVFGSPEVTGKPAGDDLREGKETYLVLKARARSGQAGRRLLERALGDAKLTDDGVEAVRELMEACGALAETEARIAELLAQAKAALAGLDGLDERARAALAALADHVIDRSA